MGYDLSFTKVDKRKIKNTKDPFWDMREAYIDDICSYSNVIKKIVTKYNWFDTEYHEISPEQLQEIIIFLKDKIKHGKYTDSDDRHMTNYVCDRLQRWLPLKDYETIYYEESY